jgi:hypothetical protein
MIINIPFFFLYDFQPIFEMYEDDIDKSVEKYSMKFMKAVANNSKKLFWHIIFAEEDGIVPGLLAFLGQSKKVKEFLLKIFPGLNENFRKIEFITRSHSEASKKKILSDFLDIMREGIALRAGVSIDNMNMCSLKVKKNSYYLYINGEQSF